MTYCVGPKPLFMLIEHTNCSWDILKHGDFAVNTKKSVLGRGCFLYIPVMLFKVLSWKTKGLSVPMNLSESMIVIRNGMMLHVWII